MEKKMFWRNVWKLNNRAICLLYQYYPRMVLSKLVLTAWTALAPYVEIYLSATVIEELAGNREVERLRILVLLTLVSAAGIALISAFLNRWMETQNAGMRLKVERIFSEKMLSLDYASLDDTHTAEVLSTVRQNMHGAGWGLCKGMESYEALGTSVFTILGGLSLTVSLFTSKVPESGGTLVGVNHPLTVTGVIAVMVAVTFLAPVLGNKSGSYFAKYANSHNLANRLIAFFGKLGYERELATDMRIYRQDRICDHYNHNKKDTFGSDGLFAHLARGPMGLYAAAGSGVSVLFTGVVYGFVCLKALGGAFGLGAVTRYVASITKVSGGMSSLVAAFGEMRNNAPFLELTFEFLDIPNNMYQGSLTVEKRRDCNYQIEFRDVSFHYPGSENWALRHVNMKVTIGKRLAVVGMNGSGKTTFIKLLCRLYDPTEGEILLNGIDIRKYNYREYMNLFSVVFQDFKLIGAKPGKQMSGGQAQKAAIARALEKKAPFLILDEPTAALDPIAEAETYRSFDEISGDKTAIYISHRLSSCKFCDEIAVFHEGAVVQRGTHATLVADKDGKYYELWQAQAQYYIE